MTLRKTDMLIVGAGPAGLATAIAARRAGMSVVLADHAVPPIDKACGEGIMPDGLEALAELGVRLPENRVYRFRGIRFLDRQCAVDASFPRGSGYGVRRTVLHEFLTQEASALGVEMRWGARVSEITRDRVLMNGESLTPRWIVGADGQNSIVRQRMNCERAKTDVRRFGFRQHFAVKPWADVVEVYWHDRGQAYVTPVAENEVCVALITSDPHFRLNEMPQAFPALAERLTGAWPSTREQGAITITRQFNSVCDGNLALVGEASGSVDAITGEGMSLGFQQAAALVEAMGAGNLHAYERQHRRIGANARRMARLMLLLGTGPRLRRRALSALSSRPELFAQMLSIHVGERKMHEFGIGRALTFGWELLRA